MNKKNSSVDVPADVLEFIEKESNFLASLYKLNTLDVHNMLEKAVLDFCESLGDKSEFIEFSSSFPELLYSANNVSSLPELLKFSKEIGIIKLIILFSERLLNTLEFSSWFKYADRNPLW